MRRGDWAWVIGGVLVLIGGILIVAFVVVPENQRYYREQDHNIWGSGYCAALGGEWLNAEACNVDGKVVPIPKEE